MALAKSPNKRRSNPFFGLTSKTVRLISANKNEPAWLLKQRLGALKKFKQLPLPTWGPNLKQLNFKEINYYLDPQSPSKDTWDKVPNKIKKTFEILGIPQAEKKFLAGVGAQYESETIYHNLQKQWSNLGVIFCDTSVAAKKYPKIFKKYFGTVVPVNDNKLSALNSAVWSGGSFIYVPKGVKVKLPLQAYFRINSPSVGQFERTLIVADEGSNVHYIEGCTAPTYSQNSLHAAVVEVIAEKNAKVRYTTIQNWSDNVYNLVTKRARAEKNARVEWVDGNFGSCLTMKYPCVILQGDNSSADILSIALANTGQIQDSGAKVIHLGSNTASKILAKSIAKNSGQTNYRGSVYVSPTAKNCKIKVRCDALLDGKGATSRTIPLMKINNATAQIEHEATVSKISQNQLDYLVSRGLKPDEAESLIICGFLDVFTKELPLEYALELNRLIKLEMTGSVG